LLIRDEQIARLARESFDLAIIGGGINGAAIARDAAMRGLNVALIERGDFAGATSSRSSKLIHGGLRYLPQGELRLVRTALAERERLRRLTAPHLVKPLRFLFPLYRGRGPGRLALGAGLWLYDLFARTPRAERHRRVNPAHALAAEPMLNPVELAGGAFYYDAGGDDARLTIENVLDAAYHGAAIANYVELERFSHAEGRIAAAEMRDRLGGTHLELRARLFVNAAGPWIDDVRRLDDSAAAPSVRLTKGVHLVIERERLPVREALVLGDAHGRIIFVIPHGEVVLVGTTDTDFDGDREHVAAELEDVEYLLGVVEQSLPGATLTPADVAVSWRKMRKPRTESSNQGRNWRICPCSFLRSVTLADIAFHSERRRMSCHCWYPKQAATIRRTAAPAAPAKRSLPEEYRVVTCCQAVTLGGSNSKGTPRSVKWPAARLKAGETAVSGGSWTPNSSAA